MAFFDLSTRALRSELKPRPKAYWHRIVPNHHIGVRVTQTNGASWVVRVRAEVGNYRSRTIGRATLYGPKGDGIGYFGFKTALKKAESFRIEQYELGIAASPFNLWYRGQMTICPVGDLITVGHALHHFVEWRRIAAAKSTFVCDLSMINHHLVPRIATIPLADFNGAHFHALCRDVLETPPNKGTRQQGPRRPIGELTDEELRKRKKTLNTLISILRTAFTLARDRGEIDSDLPIRCLRHLPCHQQPRPNYLTRAQSHRLLNASSPHLRNLIAAALYTGCRVGELTRLTVHDVADQGFGIYIARSKNHRTRFVFLPVEGMAFFLNLCLGKEPQDLVLPHPDGRFWGKRYAPPFKRAAANAGLPTDTCFHTLRHSYASQLVEDGTPLSIVARQLGHASTLMVDKVYGHLSPSWSEHTIERHFAPLLHDQDFPNEVQQRLLELRTDPTGLARVGTDRRCAGPPSKADTMPEPNGCTSWPRNNHSLFQSPLLEEIAPQRENAP